MRSLNLIDMLFLVCAAQTAWAQECNITATPVAFGAYDPYQTASSRASGRIEITCANAMPYTIRLGSGQNTSNDTLRRMRRVEGVGMLTYNLYRDAAATEIWGDGTRATFSQPGTADRRVTHLTIYGRLPARQNVSAGVYADTVTITAEW